MDLAALTSLPLELVETLAAMPNGPLLASMTLALLTAALVAFSVPGTIVPLSFTSGMLLGVPGIAVVAIGALAGSHALFLVSRHALSGWMRRRLGDRLTGIEHHLSRRGALYVFGARITGVPHLLVTAGSALTPMSSRAFASASLLGMLPAISLAAIAGSVL